MLKKTFIVMAAIFILSLPGFSVAENLIPETSDMPSSEQEILSILIVAGHDDEKSGAVFRGVREADLTLEVARKLALELYTDTSFKIVLARDTPGYILPLREYFSNHKKEIEEFISKNKKRTQSFLDKDEITLAKQVPHNDAPTDVAFRLYGINKWADEQGFDFVIHLHFNDDTSHWGNNIGKYGGFSIYAPEKTLPNSEKAEPLAEAIGGALRKTLFTSNLPLESEIMSENGVIADSKLIALGSNSTLNIPSILIEYSYIYEPHVRPEFFDLTSDVLVRATKRGIYDFVSGETYGTNLAYNWEKTLKLSAKKSKDTLALQYALRELGFYPEKSDSRDRCPLTGLFGPCTQRAVKAFQKEQGLKADGIVGADTRAILNSIF